MTVGGSLWMTFGWLLSYGLGCGVMGAFLLGWPVLACSPVAVTTMGRSSQGVSDGRRQRRADQRR